MNPPQTPPYPPPSPDYPLPQTPPYPPHQTPPLTEEFGWKQEWNENKPQLSETSQDNTPITRNMEFQPPQSYNGGSKLPELNPIELNAIELNPEDLNLNIIKPSYDETQQKLSILNNVAEDKNPENEEQKKIIN